MIEQIILWVLGLLGAVFTGGIILWATSVHKHLRSMDEHIKQESRFQGTVAEHMRSTDRRLENIEVKLGAA